jgi:hypothetical protein
MIKQGGGAFLCRIVSRKNFRFAMEFHHPGRLGVIAGETVQSFDHTIPSWPARMSCCVVPAVAVDGCTKAIALQPGDWRLVAIYAEITASRGAVTVFAACYGVVGELWWWI